ncbi:MAG: TetR/AcrR family transcriptional regulator [Actinobacteria bacterium]|nr:MAG: TetR/AcrR family transcriptional regulator [Actinomycetota bacterium]
MVVTPWGESEKLREGMLTPGPSNPAESVAENQRQRLFGAMVASVAERGYANTRVADLVELSGVSLRSFYDLFPDKQACFVGAIEALVRTTIGPVLESSGPEEWEIDSKRRGGVAASLAAAQPAAAKMCLVETYVAGPEVAGLIDGATVQMESLVRDRLAGSKRADLPPEIGTFAIGTILEIFRSRLIDHRESELPALADQLTALLLDYKAPVRPLRSAARPPEVRPEELEASDHAERALRAFEALLTEQVFGETTMEQVAKRAGMSVRTLYANFAGRDELMLAAIDSAGAQVVAAALPAHRRQPSLPEGIRAAIGSLLGLLASRPNLAHLILVAAYEGGGPALRRRAEALRPLQGLFVRTAPTHLEASRSVVAEALLGGILWLLRRRMAEAGARALPGLSPFCAYIALAPLLGAEQATAAAEGKSYRRQSPELTGPLRLASARPPDDRVLVVLGEGMRTIEEIVELTSMGRDQVEDHLTALINEGSAERVDSRGAVLYRSRWAAQRTAEWSQLAQAEREEISAEIIRAIAEDIEVAQTAGTFDARPERSLVRLPLLVDEQGWQEVHDAFELSFESLLQIQRRIRARLDALGGDAEGFRARVHLISFEAPD